MDAREVVVLITGAHKVKQNKKVWRKAVNSNHYD
jgi:hypothetical protein